MDVLICDCGGHEFIIFVGDWCLIESKDVEAPIKGACVSCGKSWGIDTAFWVDRPEQVTP